MVICQDTEYETIVSAPFSTEHPAFYVPLVLRKHVVFIIWYHVKVYITL
jgi:hypothetical protein